MLLLLFLFLQLLYLYALTAPAKASFYIEHAEIALLVYNKILEDEGVYLLPALITERNLLRCKLAEAKSVLDADDLLKAWKGKKIFLVLILAFYFLDD